MPQVCTLGERQRTRKAGWVVEEERDRRRGERQKKKRETEEKCSSVN